MTLELQIMSVEADIHNLTLAIKANSKKYFLPGNENGEKAPELNAVPARLVSEKSTRTTDLNRLRREARLKAESKAKFLSKSFGSEQDFERLWTEKLRDQALLDLMDRKKPQVDHSFFAASWNEPNELHVAGLKLVGRRIQSNFEKYGRD